MKGRWVQSDVSTGQRSKSPWPDCPGASMRLTSEEDAAEREGKQNADGRRRHQWLENLEHDSSSLERLIPSTCQLKRWTAEVPRRWYTARSRLTRALWVAAVAKAVYHQGGSGWGALNHRACVDQLHEGILRYRYLFFFRQDVWSQSNKLQIQCDRGELELPSNSLKKTLS